MIILISLILAICVVALFLRGEGDQYGSGNVSKEKGKKFFTSDKSMFL